MANPNTKVELNISCKSLAKLDKFSDSDPCAVVEEKQDGVWKEIGRTEIIQYPLCQMNLTFRNQCNPSFKKSLIVTYYFERIQPFRFRVFDWDKNSSSDLAQQQFIGQLECNLSEIVGSRGQFKRAELQNENKPKRKNGFIIVAAEEVNQLLQQQEQAFRPITTIAPTATDTRSLVSALELQIKETPQRIVGHVEKFFTGKNLDKKDLFGKSDGYFKIYRTKESQEPQLVYESEVVMKTLNPQWKEATETVQKLCNLDMDRPLKFEVWDWDKHSSHDLIGEFTTSLSAILNGKKEHAIIHPKKKTKNDYQNSGIFVFDIAKITENTSYISNPELEELNKRLEQLKTDAKNRSTNEKRRKYPELHNPYSFYQYLAGGCEISLIVAVDFTASNGDPEKRSSLHYNIPEKPSAYAQAIEHIGSILADYDHEGSFPAFGFGAVTAPNEPTNHCFPLNYNIENPKCDGIKGVLAAYNHCVKTVEQDCPTNFGPILNAARGYASSTLTSQTSQKYYILLILTDGVISDMDDAIGSIVQASKLPLSIVIVGVGTANFDAMNILDADEGALFDPIGNEHAVRDIVQFVPFNQYKNKPGLLYEKVLAEIPQQVTEYMAAFQIKPNPPIKQNSDDFDYGTPAFDQ